MSCDTVCLAASPSTHSFQVHFFYFFKFFFVCVFEYFFKICVKYSLTHSHNICYVFGGSVSVGLCKFFALGRTRR